MSEYRWRTEFAWIGVVLRKGPGDEQLLGVIRRSGVVQQTGHFCTVAVQVCGKRYLASGAEDRIFPFHSIHLAESDRLPALELLYLGWCRDHNTPAFWDRDGTIVSLTGAGKDRGVTPIPKELWQDGWQEGRACQNCDCVNDDGSPCSGYRIHCVEPEFKGWRRKTT